MRSKCAPRRDRKSETTFSFESSILNWNLLDRFRFDVSQAFADRQLDTRIDYQSLTGENIIYIDAYVCLQLKKLIGKIIITKILKKKNEFFNFLIH